MGLSNIHTVLQNRWKCKFETIIITKKRLATAQFYITADDGGCWQYGQEKELNKHQRYI